MKGKSAMGAPSNPLPKGNKMKLNKGNLLQLIMEEANLGQGRSPIVVSKKITNKVSVINSKGVVINQTNNRPAKTKTPKGKLKYAKARKSRREVMMLERYLQNLVGEISGRKIQGKGESSGSSNGDGTTGAASENQEQLESGAEQEALDKLNQ